MSDFWPYIVVGLAAGSIYALAGMGLVLTYKTSGIFNFAHGAQAALAAYLMFEFCERLSLPWPLAALVVLALVGGVGGFLLERVAHGLAAASTAAKVSATVGLMVAIQGVLVVVYGAEPKRMQFFLPARLVDVGGVNVRLEQLIVIGLVLGAVVAIHFFLSRTDRGIAMQAVVSNPELLDLEGLDPAALRRRAWIIGSSFAVLSGMLLGPTTGLDPALLTLLVFQAFGAAAVGGFTSLPWTYLGGLVIGLGAALLTKVLNTTSVLVALPSSLPFVVLFVALLAFPQGRLVEPGVGVARPALGPRRFSRRVGGAALLASGGLLVAVPALVGPRLPLYSTALGFVMVFLSLSLLMRTSGQISLCHMTFAAVGAGTFAHASEAGVPWLLAVTAGALVAVPVGAAVAIPAIRLSGIYLAIATFGLALLVQNLVFPSFLMFGTHSKVLVAPRPRVLGLATDTGYYYLVLVFAVVCCLIVVGIRRNRLGRVLRALADEPTAVDAHGTNSNVSRVLVFCISAFVAGLAGAVAAPITGSVTGVPYQFTTSLVLVAVLSIAGRQPIAGPFIAGLIYVVVPGYISSPTALDSIPIVFGAGALLAAVFGGRLVTVRLGASRRAAERLDRSRTRSRAAGAAVLAP